MSPKEIANQNLANTMIKNMAKKKSGRILLCYIRRSS